MQGFHIPAAPPLYTNTFLLISDAGHAVVIDPAAEVHSYDEILKQHNATLTTILCTHGHYDHVGSAAALKAECCLFHSQPLLSRMLGCNKYIHIIAASDAVIKAGQQTVGIRWQIKTYHICLLICNMI